MNVIRLTALLVFAISVQLQGATKEDLYGTWKLVSFIEQNPETGHQVRDLFGAEPRGYINYGRDGRMFAIITARSRPMHSDLTKVTDEARAELFKTVIAYGGTFTFDGKTATHNVDISWNETWNGTAQLRNLRLEGKKLTISTNPQPSVVDGKMGVFVLVWEKIK